MKSKWSGVGLRADKKVAVEQSFVAQRMGDGQAALRILRATFPSARSINVFNRRDPVEKQMSDNLTHLQKIIADYDVDYRSPARQK
jgi:hypothetical protein